MADPAAAQKALEKVGIENIGSEEHKSGVEPPSGYQGAGTKDEPYDQGNQPDQSATTGAKQGTEPPAGYTGAGTADIPYDQGNQPVQRSTGTNIVDELSRTKTQEDRMNGGRAAKPSIVDQLSRTKTKDEIATRKKRDSVAVEQIRPNQPVVPDDARGRTNINSVTTSSTPRDVDPTKMAPKPSRQQFERSMSPGQLDDGTHVRCSGERGEAYSPPSTLGKLKGKFHIGTN